MITIQATGYKGGAPAQPLAATFGAGGGTIGRNETNQLALPDPERLVSRVHAQVVFRAGRYVLIDQGSNPVVVNGRPLGNGVEAPLADGDELQIGAYTLRVSVSDEAAAMPAPAAASAPAEDPLGLFGPGAAPAHDPFADLLAPVPPASRTPLPEPPPAGGAKIPDDWDPFAEPMASPPPPPPPAEIDLGGGRASGSNELDALFGLGAPSAADPFAGSPLAAAPSAPNTAAAVDPLASLLGAAKPAAKPDADAVPAINEAFSPPRGVAPGPEPAPPAAGRQEVFLSWEGAGEARTEIRPPAAAPSPGPAAPPVEAAAGPVSTSDSVPMPLPDRGAVPAAAASEALPVAPRVEVGITGGPSPVMRPADADALMAAFRRGLGAPDLAMPPLTPETMELIGALLREAAEGTLQLLLARAQTKREVQAEVTMIVARGNNPLKFSPTVEVALGHLLNPPVRGFMPAAEAMRDAYDDLRSHEFGFIAGMRAALAGVLARFSPEELEKRLTQRSMLDSLLPAGRKARLWELFREMYGQISEEASEDFHSLFGKAFLAAYQEQVDRLKTKDR